MTAKAYANPGNSTSKTYAKTGFQTKPPLFPRFILSAEYWSVGGRLSHRKVQVKHNYFTSPCAALCWNTLSTLEHYVYCRQKKNSRLCAPNAVITQGRGTLKWNKNVSSGTRLKVTWSSYTGLNSSKNKVGFQGQRSDSRSLVKEENQMGWLHTCTIMKVHRFVKKQLKVSFEQLIYQMMCWTLILSPSLNPLSDFTHMKSLLRQMRLFKYSSTCIYSYVEHRTAEIRR